jgi:hypothetical protein
MYHRKQALGDIVKTPVTINPSISHCVKNAYFYIELIGRNYIWTKNAQTYIREDIIEVSGMRTLSLIAPGSRHDETNFAVKSRRQNDRASLVGTVLAKR